MAYCNAKMSSSFHTLSPTAFWTYEVVGTGRYGWRCILPKLSWASRPRPRKCLTA